MENQTKMVGEDINRQYKLADETVGGNAPEKIKDQTSEHIFYYCCVTLLPVIVLSYSNLL